MLTAYLFEKTFCPYCKAMWVNCLLLLAREVKTVRVNKDSAHGKDVNWFRNFSRERFGRLKTPLVRIKSKVFFVSKKIEPSEAAAAVKCEIVKRLDELKKEREVKWPEAVTLVHPGTPWRDTR